jgi:hypothetical protein
MTRTVIRVALACILLACVLSAGVAFADKHGKGKGSGESGDSQGGGGFRSSVIGSNPNLMIGGVPSGSAAWVVKEGKASLSPSGDLELEVKGLLITGTHTAADGTTGPVTQIAASLVCGGSGGMVVATTAAVNLSPEGDAELEAKITPPATCFATIILVRVAGTNGTLLPAPGPFIAVTGFHAQSGGGGDEGGDDQGGDH